MIPTKARRLKQPRLTKALERQYKLADCRDCTVVATRMDFAKILGKFTKVKIQFESSSPKATRSTETSSNARLKNNENGMVQVHRSAYNPHPARKLLGMGKKSKNNDESVSTRNSVKNNETPSPRQRKTYEITSTPLSTTKKKDNALPRQTYTNNPVSKKNDSVLSQPKTNVLSLRQSKRNSTSSPLPTSNVLKENNRGKKPLKIENDIIKPNNKIKYYGIVFDNPLTVQRDVRSKINLDNLLPSIDKSILPSEDWSIDYFPKRGEPKDDKIYDRIAAELEDLMYNEKTKNNSENKDAKNDEFPSILDILNDNPKSVSEKPEEQNNTVHLESSDVEAMLLGKSKSPEILPDAKISTEAKLSADSEISSQSKICPEIKVCSESEGSPLSEIKTEVSPDAELDAKVNVRPEISTNFEDNVKETNEHTIDIKPNSPSILEEPEPKEIPVLSVAEKPLNHTPKKEFTPSTSQAMEIDENDNTNSKNHNNTKHDVIQVIFKKKVDGQSTKTVICPKNLKYNILIQGKTVELLGAPKVISSVEDLQVLLQIIDESELTSLYILH